MFLSNNDKDGEFLEFNKGNVTGIYGAVEHRECLRVRKSGPT